MSNTDTCDTESEKRVRRRETEVWLLLVYDGQICGTMLGTSGSHTGKYVSLRERREEGRVSV